MKRFLVDGKTIEVSEDLLLMAEVALFCHDGDIVEAARALFREVDNGERWTLTRVVQAVRYVKGL